MIKKNHRFSCIDGIIFLLRIVVKLQNVLHIIKVEYHREISEAKIFFFFLIS